MQANMIEEGSEWHSDVVIVWVKIRRRSSVRNWRQAGVWKDCLTILHWWRVVG